MALSARQVRFGWNVAAGMTAVEAYAKAYDTTAENAAGNASNQLKNIEIKKLIEERLETLAAVAKIDQNWMLKKLQDIVDADPNELCELKIFSCSKCWSEAPDDDVDSYKLLGFDLKRTPYPHCLQCEGAGIERIFLKNSRSGAGRRSPLFAGVKQTKYGIEVKLHDQQAAQAKIFDFLGMSKTLREISGPGGGPIPVAATTVDELSDEQLAAIAAAGVE